MNQIETILIEGEKPVCISFTSEISAQTTPVLIGALTNAISNYDEIHLLVSTPGGKVAEGIAVYNAIKALPVPVITYNIGNINSIGNVVFQAGKRRVAAKISSFMFHGVGFTVQNARLELKQLNEYTASLHNDQVLIAEIMVERTKLSIPEVNELFLNMAYMNSKEALERGITDEVREIRLPNGVPIQQLIFQR